MIIFLCQNDLKRERERGSNIRMVVCSAEDAVPFLFKIII